MEPLNGVAIEKFGYGDDKKKLGSVLTARGNTVQKMRTFTHQKSEGGRSSQGTRYHNEAFGFGTEKEQAFKRYPIVHFIHFSDMASGCSPGLYISGSP